ncbi:MAG: PqqD family protein [Candidatus Acidiferrales bacterium]
MSDKYIARSKAVAARVLGGEMMIMSAVDSKLFSLSDVATVIWEAADGRTPLSEIVAQRVCAEFDVPADVAYRDAEQLVEELATRGILFISSQPVTEAEGPGPEAP